MKETGYSGKTVDKLSPITCKNANWYDFLGNQVWHKPSKLEMHLAQSPKIVSLTVQMTEIHIHIYVSGICNNAQKSTMTKRPKLEKKKLNEFAT